MNAAVRAGAIMARRASGRNCAPGSIGLPGQKLARGDRTPALALQRSAVEARRAGLHENRSPRASNNGAGRRSRCRALVDRLRIAAGSCARPAAPRRHAATDGARESGCGSRRAGRDQSTMPSAFSILWRVGRLGVVLRRFRRAPLGERVDRLDERARADRGEIALDVGARLVLADRSVSTFAIIGPASSALTTRMIVTPVSASRRP